MEFGADRRLAHAVVRAFAALRPPRRRLEPPRVVPGRSGSHPAMWRLDHIQVSVIPVREMVSIFWTAPVWPKGAPRRPDSAGRPPGWASNPQILANEGAGGGAMDGGLTSSAGVLILSASIANLVSPVPRDSSGDWEKGRRDDPCRAGPAGSGGGGSEVAMASLSVRFRTFSPVSLREPRLFRFPAFFVEELGSVLERRSHHGRGLSLGSLDDHPGRSAFDDGRSRRVSRRSPLWVIRFGSVVRVGFRGMVAARCVRR